MKYSECMVITNIDKLHTLFIALKLRPRTPSDPREAYITLIQNITELAHIFTVGIMKQS